MNSNENRGRRKLVVVRFAIQTYADRSRMVVTGPNTPEPQNRRVEIVFTHR